MITDYTNDFNDYLKKFKEYFEKYNIYKDNPLFYKNPYQEFYDEEVDKIQIHKLECPYCAHKGQFIKYGTYARFIKTPFGMVQIRIQRYMCKNCGHTHALLLSSIIPYSHLLIRDALRIIRATTADEYKEIMCDNLCIDESTISMTKYQYKKHWKERLRSAQIALDDEDLIFKCFFHYNRQFMQIRRIKNKLYINTNTA